MAWELQVVDQFRAGPYPSDFQTTMAFIKGFMLRGEKTPSLESRYPVSGWADYLSP
jgi:hypothetical protein